MMNGLCRFCPNPLRALLACVLLGGLLFVPITGTAVAQTADGGTEEIEELEDFEDFEIVEADTEPGTPELAGRLHPALVHFPIGVITLVLILELVTVVLGRRELEPAGLWVLAFGVLSLIPAAVSGLLRADSMTVSAGIYYPVELHRNLAFLVLFLCLVALAIRFKARNNFAGALRWIYLAIMAVAAGLIGFVGHLGGKMVYGENFLPF